MEEGVFTPLHPYTTALLHHYSITHFSGDKKPKQDAWVLIKADRLELEDHPG